MDLPKNFQEYQEMFPEMFNTYANGAELARTSGPLNEKTTQLIQMAAAIGLRSMGATHSHARRALAAGASHQELFQVINLLVSTVGFPTAAAGFSWIRDILESDK
jgi:4-carboxymuconolactone decarboxylase